MKTILKLLPILAILAFACSTGKKQKETTDYSIDQLLSNINMFGGRFSADEKELLITSDQSGISNAYSIPVGGGELTPLTTSDSTSIYAISFLPADKRILFHSDNNGNEIYHIYLLNEDGSSTDLTPDSAARSTFYQWNFDKESFLYGSNRRDARFMDVYEMEVETFTSKMVYKNDEGLAYSGVSRDEKYMAFVKAITTNNDELFLYSVASKKLKHISKHKGNANYDASGFELDSKALYYTTNEGAEFTYLMKYDISSGKKEQILEFDWDISYSYLTHTGAYRVTAINEDAKTRIQLNDLKNEKEVVFPEDIVGDIKSINISESEKLMTFWVGSSKSPNELYIYNFADAKATRLLSGLNPEINGDDLVEGEVIRYASFDGLEIPAILYKPHQVSTEDKGPALVWVHGGPGGQSRLSYSALIQYLVNKGYVVLAVNNRGSSGYGQTFFSLDNQNHGENDLTDCIQAKEYLAYTGFVDTANIGIIGGSYGGFMVMAALTSTPEEFKTGVNIFGVTNWVRTLKNIPPYWEAFREALYDEMGNPETDSARLYRISPLFHADKITKPFMVLQGANDPRVLQVESDEMVAEARKNGVEVEYVLFDDEGHGFSKKENKLEAYEKILVFLDEQLKGIEPKVKDDASTPETEKH